MHKARSPGSGAYRIAVPSFDFRPARRFGGSSCGPSAARTVVSLACPEGAAAVGLRRPLRDWRSCRGFTLIEILVVVAILAIVAAALALAVGGSGERRLEHEAERLRALLGQACERAELSGREIGATLTANGYGFRLLGLDGWRAFAQDGPLRPRTWPGGMQVELSREGRPLRLAGSDDAPPQLVCFSSGEQTPFTLTLALGDVPARYRLSADGTGATTLERVEGRR
jgi:general secretion pathway protein H